MNDKERERKRRRSNLVILIGASLFAAYLFGYLGYILSAEDTDLFSALSGLSDRILGFHLFFLPNTASILWGLAGGFFAALVGAIFYLDAIRRSHTKLDESAGTGGFMDTRDLQEYNKKYIEKPDKSIKSKNKKDEKSEDGKPEMFEAGPGDDFNTMIMSDKFRRPADSRALIGNNNILVVGGAGTGKSRFLMKPNILQMNSSYVITDPSGEMIHSVGRALEKHGYRIKVFNISDMEHSNCYNPLHYIRNDAGVKMLVECLINNTTKGEGGGDNQFFVDAEKLVYSACIYYLIRHCKDKSKRNFNAVLSMVNASNVDENNPGTKSPLDQLFETVSESSMAWKYYKMFKQGAGKTLKSIIISCVTRLQPFLTPEVVNLTSTDTLELEKIGFEKTALFIITPQADRTYSFLASMLYSQLFETLYYQGEERMAKTGDARLPVSVRCLMDEFANIGEIPEFPSKLSTMRKYNISSTVVLQDIAQIESMYKDDWKTLCGNCSSYIFLGTIEQNTLKYFSELLGKTTIKTKSDSVGTHSSQSYQYTSREVMTPDELGRMDSRECIVYTQNMRPVHDLKYRYELHSRYQETADADPKLGYHYKDMAAYDNTRAREISSLTKAAQEIANFKARHKEQTEGGVSNIINSNQEYVNGSSNLKMNNVHTDMQTENRAYKDCVTECVEKITRSRDKVSIIKLDYVPYGYLPKIVKQVSVLTGRDKIILFSDNHTKENLIVGVAFDNSDGNLFDQIENDYTIHVVKKAGIGMVVISPRNYETYKNSIQAAA